MAHTDRDDDRWFWREHHRNICPNAYRTRRWGAPPLACEACNAEPVHQPWWANKGKEHWNRSQRKAERTKLRQQLRQARDWDNIPAGTSKIYRRPYWD